MSMLNSPSSIRPTTTAARPWQPATCRATAQTGTAGKAPAEFCGVKLGRLRLAATSRAPMNAASLWPSVGSAHTVFASSC
ncbi:hypothetical protein FOA52_000517 [Chlamydomonas sp. UWO 241]|nr:hypothetical protein FOA52_000517 [Chlamydomonas sp. UWO 241]